MYVIKRYNPVSGLEGYLMSNGRYGHFNDAAKFEGLRAAKEVRDVQEYSYPFNEGHHFEYTIEEI